MRFFLRLSLVFFPFLDLFLNNPFSFSLSQAATAAAANAAAPSSAPSSAHPTTDTELANATPRVADGTPLAALLRKADAPAESVVDLIGGTPMVRLRRSVPPGGAVVLAKLESLQPNSSVKDR